jgi:hypothetical protein
MSPPSSELEEQAKQETTMKQAALLEIDFIWFLAWLTLQL